MKKYSREDVVGHRYLLPRAHRNRGDQPAVPPLCCRSRTPMLADQRAIATHLARFNFKSPAEAWATRIHFGQAGADRMSGTLPRFVDQQRAIKMFADWTDRIAAGELPPAPPRPEGTERNVVITMWDWGKPSGHPHDEISTDKRHPTVNANGPIYAADYNDDDLLWVDPNKNTAGEIPIPSIADKSKMQPTWPKKIGVPSPFLRKCRLYGLASADHTIR